MQGFPNSGKGWGKVNSSQWGGENWKLYWWDFLKDEENLRMSDFANLNFFQSQKQLSVNAECQLKSKLT